MAVVQWAMSWAGEVWRRAEREKSENRRVSIRGTKRLGIVVRKGLRTSAARKVVKSHVLVRNFFVLRTANRTEAGTTACEAANVGIEKGVLSSAPETPFSHR